jgi:long-subunit fatty acid transport protein
MIKKIIVSICLLISLSALAQEGTASPYSFYGIGDIKFKGTVENHSMGGVSVFPDSIHMNLQNPAQFASLKRTSLAVGITYIKTKSNTETETDKARRTSFDYLGIGIPLGKLGLGFGLIPYSSVGYKIRKITYNISDTAPFDTLSAIKSNYRGFGGVNKVFFGLGYKITKKINIGADIQYNFGTIETDNRTTEINNLFEPIQNGTRELNSSTLNGFNFDLGVTYQTKINKKLSFFSSLNYTPESKLSLNNSRTIQTFQELLSGSISIQDSQNVNVDDTTIKLPSKLSFGSGFGEVKKWLIGGEITLINSSVSSNRFNDINGATFEDAVRFSLGGYFIPNYSSFTNYYKRITYRGGIRYENTGLVIQNKSITDFAGNIGLGFPLRGSISNLNIGLEIGKRGTKYNNLVEENYVNLSIGLSLSDEWFIKRKYD